MNLYVTDYGEVRLSDREASILQTAQDARRKLGSPFINSSIAMKLFGLERAIIDACERAARRKGGIR